MFASFFWSWWRASIRPRAVAQTQGDSPEKPEAGDGPVETGGGARMTPEYWEKLKRLFDAALQQDAVSRDQFLSRACEGNRELQSEVEGMLAAHEQVGSFMAVPATPPELADEATDLASSVDPFAGHVLSHYRIEARLGSGGMGLVYRATDLKLGRAVAIKLLSRHLSTSEEAKARFSAKRGRQARSTIPTSALSTRSEKTRASFSL